MERQLIVKTKTRKMKSLISTLIALVTSTIVFSQITIDNTTYTPSQLVDGVLIPGGSGTTISNVQFGGVYNSSNRYQIGHFTTVGTTLAGLNMSEGLVLSTGQTSQIPLGLGINPGSAGQMSTGYTSCTAGEIRRTGTCGAFVNDLDILAGGNNYYNAAILEFDFVPVDNFVQFRYVFGSEEYEDDGGFINYQCSSYNDKFGFLISGTGISGGQGYDNDAKNIATLANGSEVGINSVNNGIVGSSAGSPNASNCTSANPSWVQNVSTAEFLGTIDGTELNGNTIVLTASQGGLTPGNTYHIRLIITDVGDAAYDAVVYLEAGSFTTEDPCVAPNEPSITTTIQPDCTTPTGEITVIAPVLAANEQYVLTGTAPVVASVNNTTGVFTGLAPGDYDVEIENTLTGCVSSALSLTVNVAPGSPATATASVTVQPDCTTPTGTITATLPVLGVNEQYVVTGTAPVVASVNNTTGIFTGLAPGDYDVEVENTVTGCISTALSLTVNAIPSAPAMATASVTVQPDCATPTGTITAILPVLGVNEQYVVTGTAPVVASVNNTTGIFTGLAPGDYDLEVENTVTGCISTALSLTVNAIPSAPATATASVTVQPDCTTPTGTITATLPVLGANEQYVLTGTAPVVASVNNTTGIFTGLAPGDYDVEVENTLTGCVSTALSLTVNTVPGAPASATASVTVQPDCTTPTGTITATAPVLGANEEYVLTGTAPVVASVSNTTGIFTGLAPGAYNLEVENTVTGCISIALSLTVNAIPSGPNAPTATTTTQPDCTTQTGTITVSAPTGATIEYSVDGVTYQSSPIFTGLTPGDYNVTVQDNVTGCTSSIEIVTVNAVPNPIQVDAGPDVTIQQNESTTLTAVGAGSIEWETSEFTNSIIVSPSVTTNYCVSLVDPNGCTSDDCINVTVLQDCGELYIPTAFSPDADENNDLYQIRINPLCVQSMQMQIFDRWGELIIEMNDINESWDGMYKGEPLNSASFAYVLRIKLSNNPEEQLFKGNITLIK